MNTYAVSSLIRYPKDYIGHHWITRFEAPRSRKVFIRRAIKALTLFGLDKFDTIAFRGMSGALIGPILADALNKHLILVRKTLRTDRCDGWLESDETVEGYAKARKYIIVDDFVETGATARTIRLSIKKNFPDAECLGVLEVQEITATELKRKHFELTQFQRDPL